MLQVLIHNLFQNWAKRLILVEVADVNNFEKLVNWDFLSHSGKEVFRVCVLAEVLIRVRLGGRLIVFLIDFAQPCLLIDNFNKEFVFFHK